MSSDVTRVAVDERLRALVPGAGYASAFAYRTTVSATPKQWARGVFDGPPALWRALLSLGWRFGLGLRLGPSDAARYVQGWTIESATSEEICLGAESRLMSARDVFRVEPGTVTWTTVVGARTGLGALLWRGAAPVHHATIPVLLRRARPLRF